MPLLLRLRPWPHRLLPLPLELRWTCDAEIAHLPGRSRLHDPVRVPDAVSQHLLPHHLPQQSASPLLRQLGRLMCSLLVGWSVVG